MILILTTVIVAAGLMCFSQLNRSSFLRSQAAQVQVGDHKSKVIALLGEAKYAYETGWPVGGGEPTVFGEMYGGPIDYFRSWADSAVSGLFHGEPQWYRNSLSQHFRSWPVVVVYDRDDIVTRIDR